MTGNFYLDWAILAVSLFNTILLLWLGLTVFLNAERRVWGIWLAAGGLILGSVFFISHTAIIGHGISPITPGLNFWWQIGWIPIAALPLAWYIVMLWYTGFWQPPEGTQPVRSRLNRRHRLWLMLVLAAGFLGVSSLLVFNPLPAFSQFSADPAGVNLALGGVPLLVLAYPVYTLLCISLSLDALHRPEPSGRWMGGRARDRARGWLMAVSVILLAVSLLVGWVLLWMANRPDQTLFSPEAIGVIGWFDLIIAALIAAAVILLGQAVVTYEIFTGKSLPRRGLSQYWRRALILAGGFSLVLAWSLSIQLRPIYSTLLSMLLLVVFYALLGWRAYAERERSIQNLRPFVSRQRFYADIVAEDDNGLSTDGDVGEPFNALCSGILETRQACLVPLGALAPLSGTPLVFPNGFRFELPPVGELVPRLRTPTEPGVTLEPKRYSGMVFAVSLWNERGLVGVLLLGEKQSGGLYTQEEIEIARVVGEHMLDTKASTEMARRLIRLQRQRLAQSQVLDQQTRRVLHDEILPSVHTALLDLSTGKGKSGEQIDAVVAQLEGVHRQLSDLLRSLPATAAVEVRRSGFIGALRKTVEVDLKGSFDDVSWDIQPAGEQAAAALPAMIAEVLFAAVREAVRNAARHGRRPDSGERYCLKVEVKSQNGLVIAVEDNGAGFSIGEPLSESGGKTGVTDPVASVRSADRGNHAEGSSGQGLALHSTLMAVIGGLLTIESRPGQSTRVTVELPEAAWDRWE